MTVFTMVTWIVVVGCLTGVISDYLKTRRVEAKQRNAGGSEQLEALTERVRVLERIVTDERYDLRREIKELERHG
jgi:uncharacterized membrane protein